MKKILITLMIIAPLFSFSQTVNGIPLQDINVEFVQIVGTSNWTGNKVTIDIDFGQFDKVFSGKDTKIMGDDGKPVQLNSMIDALNFMIHHGYEYIDAYTVTMGNSNVYHYLLRKKDWHK